MLIRLDDSAVSGAFSIDGAIDARALQPEEIAGLIIERLLRNQWLRVGPAQEKVPPEEHVSSLDLAIAQLDMQRLDALMEGRPMKPSEQAGNKLQKIFKLEGLIKRLWAEGRPAMAWKLQRQKEAIQNEGRVATSSQRRFDRIIDIEAEKNVLKEEAQRQKKKAEPN